MDDFRGSCGAGKYPLLSAIANVFGIQSPGRSSFLDDEFDDYFSGSSRRGAEGRSRDVVSGGLFSERDRDRAATTRFKPTSRRRDRPLYTDDDDYNSVTSDLESRDDRHRHGVVSTRSRQQTRRRQDVDGRRQSLDLDDVNSGRSSRRRTTLADNLADSFRRYDDVDDNARRSDHRRDEELRRDWSEPAADDRPKSYGRRKTSQDSAARGRQPDAGVWNDDTRATSSSSSSFFEENSFTTNRRASAGGADGRDRFAAGRRRPGGDYNELPVDGEFRSDFTLCITVYCVKCVNDLGFVLCVFVCCVPMF